MLMAQLEHLSKEMPSLLEAKTNVAAIERDVPQLLSSMAKRSQRQRLWLRSKQGLPRLLQNQGHMAPLPCKMKALKNSSQKVFVQKRNVLE